MPRVEIKSTENGPNLVYLDGKVFTALSRMRRPNNKTFCNGTHARIGSHVKPADLKVLADHSKIEVYIIELRLIPTVFN
jgi:CDGSH-type Zn-finger protein